jgi:hypothetical protein
MLLLVEASGTAALAVTVGAGGTISMQCSASYADNNAGTITPGTQNTAIANTTKTTIVAQNGTSGVQRNIKSASIFNGGTAPNTVTVNHTDGTTAVNVYQATLLVGESIHYDEGDGWNHYSANGAEYLQQLGAGASGQNSSVASIVPTSTTLYTMAGTGVLITPQRSGTILAMFCGFGTPNATTIDEGVLAQFSWAAGSVLPAAAAAAAGTVVGKPIEYSNAIVWTTAADARNPIALHSLITGLTIGTEYWVDLQLEGLTGAAVMTIYNPVLTLIEI